MTGQYILNGKTPVPCNDLIAWATWFEKADRHVAVTKIGSVAVSTVFLGIDHNYNGDVPHIFETMIFGIEDDSYMKRCSTWEEAEAQHKEACVSCGSDAMTFGIEVIKRLEKEA